MQRNRILLCLRPPWILTTLVLQWLLHYTAAFLPIRPLGNANGATAAFFLGQPSTRLSLFPDEPIGNVYFFHQLDPKRREAPILDDATNDSLPVMPYFVTTGQREEHNDNNKTLLHQPHDAGPLHWRYELPFRLQHRAALERVLLPRLKVEEEDQLNTKRQGSRIPWLRRLFRKRRLFQSRRRRQYPTRHHPKPQPPQHVSTNTKIPSCDALYLLGVEHGSDSSIHDTQALLGHVRPSIIAVELCPERTLALLGPKRRVGANQTREEEEQSTRTRRSPPPQEQEEPPINNNNNKAPSSSWAAKLTHAQWCWRQAKMLQQSYRVGPDQERITRLGALSWILSTGGMSSANWNQTLSSEMEAAFQWWKDQQTSPNQRPGVELILMDRPLEHTLQRYDILCQETQWKQYQTIVHQLLFPKSKSKTKTRPGGKHDPHNTTLQELMISERDAFMACKITQAHYHFHQQRMKQQQEQSRRRSWWWPGRRNKNNKNQQQQQVPMVAIVGAAHVTGIEEWLQHIYSQYDQNDKSEKNPMSYSRSILSQLVASPTNPKSNNKKTRKPKDPKKDGLDQELDPEEEERDFFRETATKALWRLIPTKRPKH